MGINVGSGGLGLSHWAAVAESSSSFYGRTGQRPTAGPLQGPGVFRSVGWRGGAILESSVGPVDFRSVL